MKKGLIAILFLIVVFGAGLAGSIIGGLIVYQGMTGKVGAASSPVAASATSVTDPTAESITIQTANINTAITQAVEQVGPAVVTVVGQLPDQMSFFGVISGGTASGSGVIFLR